MIDFGVSESNSFPLERLQLDSLVGKKAGVRLLTSDRLAHLSVGTLIEDDSSGDVGTAKTLAVVQFGDAFYRIDELHRQVGSLWDPDSSIIFEPLQPCDLDQLGIDMTQAYDFGTLTFHSVNEEGHDWGGALKGYCFRDDHGKDIISFGRQEVEAGVGQSFFDYKRDHISQ